VLPLGPKGPVARNGRGATPWGRTIGLSPKRVPTLYHPPTWRARASLLIWVITFDLSSMGDSTSSKITPA